MLVLGLQDRWQPIREDQLAMRTNDCWLPGETGPRTNGRGPTILCLSFQSKFHAQALQWSEYLIHIGMRSDSRRPTDRGIGGVAVSFSRIGADEATGASERIIRGRDFHRAPLSPLCQPVAWHSEKRHSDSLTPFNCSKRSCKT